jgi:hypothetical protein
MLSVNTIVVGSFARTWMVEEASSLLESQHGDKQKSACLSAAPYAVSGEREHGIAIIFH